MIDLSLRASKPDDDEVEHARIVRTAQLDAAIKRIANSKDPNEVEVGLVAKLSDDIAALTKLCQ